MRICCTKARLVVATLFVVVSAATAQDGRRVQDDPLPPDARLRIGSTRFRDPNYIGLATLAPDGKTIALLSQGQTIRILDVDTGNEVRRIPMQEGPRNNQMHFTADGRQIVSVGYNGIHFFDVQDGKRTKHLQINRNPNGPIYESFMSLSADGKLLAQGSQDRGDGVGTASILNLEDSKELMKVNPVQNSYVYPFLSPDGKWLATWGQYYNRQGGVVKEEENPNRMVQIWDIATGKEKHKLTTDTYQVQCVRFSPDGKKVATAGNGMLQLWNLETGKLERRFACRSGQGTAIAFSPDGKTIAASGRDSTVQQWEIATGKRLGMCEGPQVQLTSLQYRPDGQLLAWGIQGTGVQIWEVPSGRRLTPEGGHAAAINGLFFELDGKSLISSGQDGRILRWNTATGKEEDPIATRPSTGSGTETRYYRGPGTYRKAYSSGGQTFFSPNGKYMIGGSDNGPASAVYEMPSGIEVFSLVAPGGYVDRNGPVLFAPDSTKVTILNRGGPRQPGQATTITIWDLDSGLPLPQLKGQQGEMHAGGFSTDGRLLATASMQYTPQGQQVAEVWVWDVETGKDRAKIHMPNFCTSILFVDQRRFIAASANMGWKLYDAPSGKEIGGFEGNAAQVTAQPLRSPDGRLVAVGTASNQIHFSDGRIEQQPSKVIVWETASGMIRHEFTGHMGSVMSLAFSRDGKTLATGGLDTTILFWDLRGKPVSAADLRGAEIDALWKVLDERHGKRAENAIRKLCARPAETLAWFGKHVKPIEGTTVDGATIGKLIKDLDASRFVIRESASKQLEKVGRVAVEPLRAALKGNPSEELRERIDKLLGRIDRPDDGEQWLRPLRCIEVLERIGTSEAKALLANLAKGADAPPTRAASEALARFAK